MKEEEVPLKDIEGFLKIQLTKILGHSEESFAPDTPLVKLGLDSYGFMELVYEIESEFKFQLSESEMMSSDSRSLGGLVNLIRRHIDKVA